MEKYITDESTGLKYELAGDEEPEREPIGIWGQRHGKYLREHKLAIYSGLLISGKLDSYLRNIDRQAEEMFSWLVKEFDEKEGITETLKAEKQLLWVQRMNAIREAAVEIVNDNMIYA